MPIDLPGLGDAGPQPGFELPSLDNSGLPGLGGVLPGLDGGLDGLLPGVGESPVPGFGNTGAGTENAGNWISQLTNSINNGLEGITNVDPGSWLTDRPEGHDGPGSDRRHDPAPGEGDFHTQQSPSPGGVTAPSGVGIPPVLPIAGIGDFPTVDGPSAADFSAATTHAVDRMFPGESRDENAPHASGLPGLRFARRRSANNDAGERDSADSTMPEDDADSEPPTNTQWI
ncbi:hypothetical protein [Nocardia cyriacigeorgica]|nr:hypothetical protein [Nocardia cyriacigeorgica]